MAKIKNVSGDNRTLSAAAGGQLVLKKATVDVPDDEVYNYTQQDIWEPYDDAAQAAHEAGEAAYAERLAAHEVEHRALLGIPAGEELDDEDALVLDDEPPAGNASRDEWVEFVKTEAGGNKTDEDLEGLGRDEIRDQYKSEQEG